MMGSEFLLRLAGAMQIALAVAHLFFPKYLNWNEELPRLSRLNHQIFIVHTIFIGYVLVLFGALSLIAPQALLEPTALSRIMLGGLAGFWGMRLLFQWFVYDWSSWRGSSGKTIIHIGISVFWIYLTAVYGCLLWGALR